VTYYDAGLGSMPPEGAFFVVRACRWLHNLFSLATGLTNPPQSLARATR
jgi:hypothetical protein